MRLNGILIILFSLICCFCIKLSYGQEILLKSETDKFNILSYSQNYTSDSDLSIQTFKKNLIFLPSSKIINPKKVNWFVFKVKNTRDKNTIYYIKSNFLDSIVLYNYENNQIIGVISIFEIKNEYFETQKSFQIRGMAVLPTFQKQGVGEALVKEAEKFCTTQKADLIWFNARSTAVGFYQKMGYEIVGSEFEINDVGPHFLMFKKLSMGRRN